MRGRGIAALGLAVSLAGCGAADDRSDSLGGFGLPTVTPGEVSGLRAQVTGTFRVEPNGCFTLETSDGERRWVVFPAGAAHDGDAVRLPDGTRPAGGSRLTGTGVVTTAEALPDWASPDSYFRSFGTFCAADLLGVVAFDEVRVEG